MAKEELGITEENEMTEMSEEELESVAGGSYCYDHYNEIYNDSSRDLYSKCATIGINLDRVTKLLRRKDLPDNQRRDLCLEQMHLQSLRKKLIAQIKEQQ